MLPPSIRTSLLAVTSTVALAIPLIIFYTWHTRHITWLEPDPGLLSTPTVPHSYSNYCDASLGGPLLLIAVFSKSSNVDKRTLVRMFEKHDLPPSERNLIDFQFILGRPSKDDNGGWKDDWNYVIEREMEREGDLVVLDVEENMDDGKTHAFFQWLATKRPGPKPHFVLKADDDTFLVIPNIISTFRSLNCSANVYLGTSRGSDPIYNDYFRGMAYALSLPLYTWLGSSTPSATSGLEDVLTGAWLQSLNPATDPLQRVDMEWAMGDWNQVEVSTATIGLHWLKKNGWWVAQVRRVREAWDLEKRDFRWDNGIPMRDIVARGQYKPDLRVLRADFARLHLDAHVPIGGPWKRNALPEPEDDDRPS